MSRLDVPGSVAPWERPRAEETAAVRCPACGETNSESARFCQQCAEPLAEPSSEPRPRPVVATAYAVACEVLGEERVEHALEILERAGGEPQELDDAEELVVAVFGPEPPGGQAGLVAVRAAAEIAELLAPDGRRPEGEQPSGARIGVGACDVFEGDLEGRSSERVIGLAVRLQRMAAPGEVVIAEDLHRLVEDAATAEPVDPHAEPGADGSTGPVRLLAIAPRPKGPAWSTIPLVGRDRERAELRELLDRAVVERSARLVGIVGDAGIGKTALVEQVLGSPEVTGPVTVLRVRCRPASQAGTTWPLAEIVEQAAGIDGSDGVDQALGKLGELLGPGADGSVLDWAADAIALPVAVAPTGQTARAFSRVLSAVAGRRPLVLWADDAERVDPTFWHALRAAAARMSEVPLIVLCAARELATALDGSGLLDVARLEPLAEDDLVSLAEGLLGAEVDEGVQGLLAETSGGNPFVAEHLLAMLVEEGLVRWDAGRFVPTQDLSAPPTPPGAEAVLRARLDWLAHEEQIVAGLSAVIGETFPTALLAELLPHEDRANLEERLGALVDKGLIRRLPGGDESYAFRHTLVREAAAKYVREEARAEVHEHCAMWLETTAGGRAARRAEEIARHLVSAIEIQRRLGRGDRRSRDLAERAVALLEEAAGRAGRLGDARGAFLLLERACALLPEGDPRRADLLLRGARAIATLEDQRAGSLLAEAASSARTAGAPEVEWRARIAAASLALGGGFSLDALERANATVERAIEAFEQAGDEEGLASAWSLRSAVYLRWGNLARCAVATERAVEHAHRAGLAGEEVEGLRTLAWAILNGPLPVDDAIERCEGLRTREGIPGAAARDAEGVLAVLHARAGRIDEARRLASGAIAALEEVGLEDEADVCRCRLGQVEALAGDRAVAGRELRRVLERRLEIPRLAPGDGRDRIRAQAAASLAHLAALADRPDEAMELSARAERDAAPEDFPTQVGWRVARALALALLGRLGEAEALARIAVRLAEQTDAAPTRAEALLGLAKVRAMAGRANEAVAVARRALRGFDRRGARAQAALARDVLARFGGEGSPAPSATSTADPMTGSDTDQMAANDPDPMELPEAPPEPPHGVWGARS